MATQQPACCINEQRKRQKEIKRGGNQIGKEGFDGKKWRNIQFVWRMWCSLGELKDEMAEDWGEIFFVTCRCFLGIKCHTVNVKGGAERWDWRRGSAITFPPVSLLLCLGLCVLKPAVCFLSCCFWSSSVSWLPPPFCPEARIYPSICI